MMMFNSAVLHRDRSKEEKRREKVMLWLLRAVERFFLFVDLVLCVWILNDSLSIKINDK